MNVNIPREPKNYFSSKYHAAVIMMTPKWSVIMKADHEAVESILYTLKEFYKTIGLPAPEDIQLQGESASLLVSPKIISWLIRVSRTNSKSKQAKPRGLTNTKHFMDTTCCKKQQKGACAPRSSKYYLDPDGPSASGTQHKAKKLPRTHSTRS